MGWVRVPRFIFRGRNLLEISRNLEVIFWGWGGPIFWQSFLHVWKQFLNPVGNLMKRNQSHPVITNFGAPATDGDAAPDLGAFRCDRWCDHWAHCRPNPPQKAVIYLIWCVFLKFHGKSVFLKKIIPFFEDFVRKSMDYILPNTGLLDTIPQTFNQIDISSHLGRLYNYIYMYLTYINLYSPLQTPWK